MQLSGVSDKSASEHANADGRLQCIVILALLQLSDIGFGCVIDHPFLHPSGQRYLDFDVELSTQLIFRKYVQDAQLASGSLFLADGIDELDFGDLRLPLEHGIEEVDGNGHVHFAAEQHFKCIINKRIDPNWHGHLEV